MDLEDLLSRFPVDNFLFIFEYLLNIPALSRTCCPVWETGALKEKNIPRQEDAGIREADSELFILSSICCLLGRTTLLASLYMLLVLLNVQAVQTEKWGERAVMLQCEWAPSPQRSHYIDSFFDRLHS